MGETQWDQATPTMQSSGNRGARKDPRGRPLEAEAKPTCAERRAQPLPDWSASVCAGPECAARCGRTAPSRSAGLERSAWSVQVQVQVSGQLPSPHWPRAQVGLQPTGLGVQGCCAMVLSAAGTDRRWRLSEARP